MGLDHLHENWEKLLRGDPKTFILDEKKENLFYAALISFLSRGHIMRLPLPPRAKPLFPGEKRKRH